MESDSDFSAELPPMSSGESHRWARFFGPKCPWVDCGTAGFIEAAQKYAEAHPELFKDNLMDVLVRCDSWPPGRRLFNFRIQRVTSFICLNPRQGSD